MVKEGAKKRTKLSPNNGEQAAEQEGGGKARGTGVMQQGLAS